MSKWQMHPKAVLESWAVPSEAAAGGHHWNKNLQTNLKIWCLVQCKYPKESLNLSGFRNSGSQLGVPKIPLSSRHISTRISKPMSVLFCERIIVGRDSQAVKRSKEWFKKTKNTSENFKTMCSKAHPYKAKTVLSTWLVLIVGAAKNWSNIHRCWLIYLLPDSWGVFHLEALEGTARTWTCYSTRWLRPHGNSLYRASLRNCMTCGLCGWTACKRLQVASCLNSGHDYKHARDLGQLQETEKLRTTAIPNIIFLVKAAERQAGQPSLGLNPCHVTKCRLVWINDGSPCVTSSTKQFEKEVMCWVYPIPCNSGWWLVKAF